MFSKRIIALILCFVTLFLLACPVFAAEPEYVSTSIGFWDYMFHQASRALDGISILDDMIPLGYVVDLAGDILTNSVCSLSGDSYHHADTIAGCPVGRDDEGYYAKPICKYCNQYFKYYSGDMKQQFEEAIGKLPGGLDSSSSGVTKYGKGFTYDTANNDAANAFWANVDVYSMLNSADASIPGGHLLLGRGYYKAKGSIGTYSQYCGVSLSDSTPGLLVGFVASSLVPYTSAMYGVGEYQYSTEFSIDTDYVTSFNYNWGGNIYKTHSLFRSRDEAYAYWKQTGSTVHYLTSESRVYFDGLKNDFAYGGSRYYHCYPVYSFRGYGCIESNGKETFNETSILDQGYIFSGSTTEIDLYESCLLGLYPLSESILEEDDPGNRVGELTQIINQYNVDNSITNNITNVNYYLGVLDENGNVTGNYAPGLYNDKTLVFTEPITGAQLQTSGWHYDYDTRTYEIDLVSGTFTAGGVDITGIVLTYGDDNVTIEYCDSSGTVIVTDTFAYVMTSGSACSLDGHSYTYETIKEPTCSGVGERKYTCSICGDEYAENVPSLEHIYTYTEINPPTCYKDGLGMYTCGLCGAQFTESMPKTDHVGEILERVETEYDEDGGVVSYGYTVYNCTLCGDQYTVSDAPEVEEESWFGWLGEQFRRLMSSIVGGLGDGLEYLTGTVIKPVTRAGLGLIEWLFELVDLDKLDIWYSWFDDGNAYFDNEFGTEVDVWATG